MRRSSLSLLVAGLVAGCGVGEAAQDQMPEAGMAAAPGPFATVIPAPLGLALAGALGPRHRGLERERPEAPPTGHEPEGGVQQLSGRHGQHQLLVGDLEGLDAQLAGLGVEIRFEQERHHLRRIDSRC